MIWLNKDHFPVEFVKGKRFVNFMRWLFLVSVWASVWNKRNWQRSSRAQFDEVLGLLRDGV